MTGKEAIQILQSIEFWNRPFDNSSEMCNKNNKREMAIHMAISALSENKEEPTYYPPCIDCNKKMDEIRRAYDKLKEMPSVENKGEWILDETDNTVECNKCGCQIYPNDISHGEPHFCPNCGADMRGE